MEEERTEIEEKLYLIGMPKESVNELGEALRKAFDSLTEVINDFVEQLNKVFDVPELQQFFQDYFDKKYNQEKVKESFVYCKSNINKNKFNNKQFNNHKSVRKARNRLR